MEKLTTLILSAGLAILPLSSALAVPSDKIKICNKTTWELADVYLKTTASVSIRTNSWFTEGKTLMPNYCRTYNKNNYGSSTYHVFYHTNYNRIATRVEPGIRYEFHEDEYGEIHLYH